MKPDRWQAELIRSSDNRILICAGRQVGKSQASAALALKEALLGKSLVLLVSPSQRQSKELFLKVLDLYNRLGQPVPKRRPYDNVLRLELQNGSRIESLPSTEQTIRGFSSVGLIILDEAARIEDSLYHAVRPFLAVSGGKLIAVSSAYARQGFFYEEWSGKNRWKRVSVKAESCPRISPRFLEEERQALGETVYRMEYENVFAQSLDTVFNMAQLRESFRSDVTPLFGEN
jgi:hypothetical protein